MYALSALLEIHTIVHLKDGGIWTMMENLLDHHDELLSPCELQLSYMGHGLFVELVRRKHPLIIVNKDMDVKTIKLGCLTFDEEETLNYIIYHGLGKALVLVMNQLENKNLLYQLLNKSPPKTWNTPARC